MFCTAVNTSFYDIVSKNTLARPGESGVFVIGFVTRKLLPALPLRALLQVQTLLAINRETLLLPVLLAVALFASKKSRL